MARMTQPSSATTPPPASTPHGASAGGPGKRQKEHGSVKETIESILVAFILAFIFRAFVVEAFVIPTGSMAPTLLGAHMRFTCNDCGWRFDANYSPEKDSTGEDLYIPPVSSRQTPHTVYCPNCGFRIPRADALRPNVHYGDRILVLKYLYLFEDPQRWDVVVFKSPDVRATTLDEPAGDKPSDYQQNYIKRLIGNPGESVLILDGDIYVGQKGKDPSAFEVQTKPRHVQEALWRVIYDNDYHPQRLNRDDAGTTWRQPWTVRGGAGWNIDDKANKGRVFRFDNPAGESTLFFDRTANPIPLRSVGAEPYAFTDWLAYDAEVPPPLNIVRDLKLAFFYHRQAGDGPLRVTMTSGDDAFVATVTPEQATLTHVSKTGETPIGEPFSLAGTRSPIRVELTNVDYQVTLRINDAAVAQTTPQQYRPNVAALLARYKTDDRGPAPTLEISAANQTAALSHIGLWRDIYYLNRAPGQTLVWGVPGRIIDLGPEEYFVLGDNSLISGDARYWSVPISLPADRLEVEPGRVPGRFLLGRAFFVYWPAGFKPAPALPGLAPNFGDMRFIR